ncbi:azlC family protein, partial [Vibrio parahaemolyticus V-223/04]
LCRYKKNQKPLYFGKAHSQ